MSEERVEVGMLLAELRSVADDGSPSWCCEPVTTPIVRELCEALGVRYVEREGWDFVRNVETSVAALVLAEVGRIGDRLCRDRDGGPGCPYREERRQAAQDRLDAAELLRGIKRHGESPGGSPEA